MLNKQNKYLQNKISKLFLFAHANLQRLCIKTIILCAVNGIVI